VPNARIVVQCSTAMTVSMTATIGEGQGKISQCGHVEQL